MREFCEDKNIIADNVVTVYLNNTSYVADSAKTINH